MFFIPLIHLFSSAPTFLAFSFVIPFTIAPSFTLTLFTSMRFLRVGLFVLAATQAALSAPVFRRRASNDVYLHPRSLKVFTRGGPEDHGFETHPVTQHTHPVTQHTHPVTQHTRPATQEDTQAVTGTRPVTHDKYPEFPVGLPFPNHKLLFPDHRPLFPADAKSEPFSKGKGGV
ncbi:hypothetical protein K439DRAFT_396062 [Ramaria rubella]|nr:hypothetical protein K439DRAFT_396062 [Ramaria rubella]